MFKWPGIISRTLRKVPLSYRPTGGGYLLASSRFSRGIEISEATVSRYMIRRRGPPSQTWYTFLENHERAYRTRFPYRSDSYVQGARRIPSSYANYYNRTRTHLSSCKDSPDGRTTQLPEQGRVVELDRVGTSITSTCAWQPEALRTNKQELQL